MKKFIVIAVAAALAATGTANAQHGHYGGGYRGGGCGIGLGIGLGIVGAAVVYDCCRPRYYPAPIIVQQPCYQAYPAPVMVQQPYYQAPVVQTGHWENRVAYRTVMRPVYHPDTYGYRVVNNHYVPYIQAPAWTEMVPTQEPTCEQVWVP